MATAASSCSEKEIELPINDAATCWWLSTNLVLFHKKRTELEALFSSYEEYQKKTNPQFHFTVELWSRFEAVYKFYTNQQQLSQKQLIDIRIEKDMEIFNTTQFKINGSDFQDAQEYLQKLFQYIPIHTFYIVTVAEQNNPKLHLWDITMVEESVGIPGKVEKQVDRFQCNRYTNTIIVNVNRSNPTDTSKRIPLKEVCSVLETIDIPLIDSEENLIENPITDSANPLLLKEKLLTTSFELDAILCVTDGHYFAYVKCSASDEWLYYGAMAEGKLKTSFTNFSDMMKRQADLPKQATLLMYSKVITSNSK
jgi:hypothetical protein